ncbi:MAG TPA: twin-arginine translocation signal domain-containing protein [Acetobacteraceae bacterium]|nr:twin-arginine translocation signal domain-containing protein [Acetobacteraceae bacterium]
MRLDHVRTRALEFMGFTAATGVAAGLGGVMPPTTPQLLRGLRFRLF